MYTDFELVESFEIRTEASTIWYYIHFMNILNIFLCIEIIKDDRLHSNDASTYSSFFYFQFYRSEAVIRPSGFNENSLILLRIELAPRISSLNIGATRIKPFAIPNNPLPATPFSPFGYRKFFFLRKPLHVSPWNSGEKVFRPIHSSKFNAAGFVKASPTIQTKINYSPG